MASRGAGHTPSGDPHPGELLGVLLGNYRILSKLGQGGMGEVYVGRHEQLGHRVAVKVLQLELSRRADMVRRFFNEAQAATAIRNLGIVQVFDFGTAPDGRAYFVMELLEGQSLAARLKQRRLDYAESCRLGRQAANVLQAAHAAGITHRDLKPDNLFLIPDSEVLGGERVKVLDFGIAKVLTGISELVGDSTEVKTRTGLMMGTPHYMSPEQCRGAGLVDARSDIYSLGCILFKMTCGRPPFIGEGAGEILGAHQYLESPHPHSFAPDLPPELAGLIARMLAKHPDARPQAMSMVSQALDEILWALEPEPRVSGRMRVPTLTPVSGSSLAPVPGSSPMRSPVASTAPPPVSSTAPLPVSSAEPSIVESAVAPDEPRGATQAGSTGTSDARTRRRWLLLGGLAVAGAALALVGVLAVRGSGWGWGSSSPEARLASNQTTPPAPADAFAGTDVAAPEAAVVLVEVPDAAVAAPDAAVAAVAAPDAAVAAVAAPNAGTAPPVTPHPPPVNVMAAGRIVEAECLRYQTDEDWNALHACAQRLKPSNAPLASKLMNRATQEIRSALRIAGVETALREKSLKRARAELDQVWIESNGYQRIKAKYDAAEEAAIAALVADLKRVSRGDCKEYQRILAQQREAQPPRVSTEAQRQVECTVDSSSPKCDDTQLSEKGKEQVAAGKFAAALASYEAAYACKPTLPYLRRIFVIACNLKDVKKAKATWIRLPEDLKRATLNECVRNGITERQLDPV